MTWPSCSTLCWSFRSQRHKPPSVWSGLVEGGCVYRVSLRPTKHNETREKIPRWRAWTIEAKGSHTFGEYRVRISPPSSASCSSATSVLPRLIQSRPPAAPVYVRPARHGSGGQKYAIFWAVKYAMRSRYSADRRLFDPEFASAQAPTTLSSHRYAIRPAESSQNVSGIALGVSPVSASHPNLSLCVSL